MVSVYHYINVPMQYNVIFMAMKINDNFQRTSFDFFVFLLKYRFWALIRTGSFFVLDKKNKNKDTPVIPSLTCKSGSLCGPICPIY